MAINIISETYNGQPQLQANVGDRVKGIVDFSVEVTHLFTENNKMFYKDFSQTGAGVWGLEWTNGDWEAEGFSNGDDIEVRFVAKRRCGSVNISNINVVWYGTIGQIQPDKKSVILTGALVAGSATYPVTTPSIPYGVAPMPGASRISPVACANGTDRRYEVGDGIVMKIGRPEEIQFDFNLAGDGSDSLLSLIDGTINRFKYTTPVNTSLLQFPMQQVGVGTGGIFEDVKINQLEDSGATTKWRIEFDFIQWVAVEDGYLEPNYYDGIECVVPVLQVRCVSNANNPSVALSQNTGIGFASTGGFNEAYNSGENDFSLINCLFYDSLGNSITALDYSNDSTFIAKVLVGNSQDSSDTYNLGVLFRPEDSSLYKNVADSLGNSLMLNAPAVDFPNDGTTDVNTYVGSENLNGAGFDITDVKITLSGIELIIEGKFIPKNGSTNFFSQIPDGGRKTTLWISITQENGKKVSLKLFDNDNIDAPIVGVQIPNVLTEELIDHGGNFVTINNIGNTTTEDNMLFKSDFRLPTGVIYDGLRVKISAFNTNTLEQFTLEQFYFDLFSTVTQNGVMQINEVLSRNFNLPPSSLRNGISIKRKPTLDITDLAGYELSYGFLNDWRYWQSLSSVNNYFFDLNEPFNGKNRNWQQFYTADWFLKLSYHTDLDGVEDFNNYIFKIRPYEDDLDVQSSTTYKVISDNSTPTSLVNDELIEITNIFNWNDNFTDEWVEFTVEDFESGNRWVMSSVEPHGNVQTNPFKPLLGLDKIEVSGAGTNVLTCKCLIDTSLINVNKVSLSFRVFSAPLDGGGLDPLITKFKEDGTVKVKEDGTVKIIE